MNRTTPRLPPPDGPEEGHVDGDGVPLRVVLLGESTVAGVGAPSRRQALSGSLAAVIGQESRRAIDWHAVGQNGTTAESSLHRLMPRVEGRQADLVVVALGVNDVILFTSLRRWTEGVRRLMDEVRLRLGETIPILFSGVPPMGCFPAFPQPLRSLVHLRSRQFDAALREVAHSTPHAYHAPLPFRGGRAFFCEDGFHPSPLGYAAWAELMRPVAQELLWEHGLVRAD